MKDKYVVTMDLISYIFKNLRLGWKNFRMISLAIQLMKPNLKPLIRPKKSFQCGLSKVTYYKINTDMVATCFYI